MEKYCRYAYILAHEYFGINLPIVWALIEKKIPDLIVAMGQIIKEYKLNNNSINFKIE